MSVRHFQPVYCGCNRPNVSGSVVVSMAGVPTYQALELSLILAIGLIAMAAFCASAGRVARVNCNDGYAVESGLVLQKAAELSESPSSNSGPLAFPKPCPVADTFQVFQGDSARRVLSQVDDLLADNVVDVLLKTGLFASSPLHCSASIFTGPPLVAVRHALPKRLSSSVVFFPDSLDGVSAENVSVARGCQINHTQVDAYELIDFDWWGFWQVHRAEQKEFVVPVDKVALTLESIKAFLLVLTHDKRYHFPAVDRQQANAIQALEGHQPFVVDHCPSRPEFRANLLAHLKAINSLANRSHCHLGRQAELLPQFVIAATMDRGPTEHASVKSDACCIAGRRIELPHRGQQQAALSVVGKQLDLEREFHGVMVDGFYPQVNRKGGITSAA